MTGTDEPRLPWPLRYLVDRQGRDTGFAMLRRGIRGPARPVFDEMRAAHRMIGFTHYGPFPLQHPGYDGPVGHDTGEEGWRRPEVEACEAWCHCFRQPDLYLPPGTPRFLVSGSDFVQADRLWRMAHTDDEPQKRWDLIYCCIGNWFNEMQKNWSLARGCLELLAEAGLTILAVGRAGSPDLPTHPGIEVRRQLPWTELIHHTARARVAFLPNRLDASPRVLTEALALDLPVLVNADILGGWKYVNDATGEFFADESDVVEAALRCLDGGYEPRAFVTEHYGQERAAVRLAEHLRTLGAADDLEYALPSDTRTADAS